MEPILNFCRQEITAATEEEARSMAPFFIVKNVTMSYKKWRLKQKGIITNSMILNFLADFLYTNSRATPGLGFIITVERAITQKRKNPSIVTYNKKREGRTKYNRIYQLIDEDSNILEEIYNNKKEAIRKARKIVSTGKFNEITCRRIRVAIPPDDTVFKVKYYGGRHCRKGVYIVFGIKNLK